MISEELALEKILDAVEPLEAETMPLGMAFDRYAAGSFLAKCALPMFDNSSMDGYAVRAADCAPGAKLRVAGEQPAGVERALILPAGAAIRIFTGAPIPQGADGVIMQEDVDAGATSITINSAIAPGENIRRRGSDLAEGQQIVAEGDRITPQRASLLASQGVAEISVVRAPRVAVLSTGDELISAGQPLAPGQLYESNGVMLQMLASAAGGSVTNLGIAPDEPEALRAKLAAGLRHDAIIISGGVSVGARDFVKSELKNLGAELDIWRVAVKPGKPFLFGRCGSCKVFGLPGNPVSSFVTFFCFVRPALLKMCGSRDLSPNGFPAIATGELHNAGDRPHYIRGRFSAGEFTPFGRQESHALFGLSQSNALVRLDPEAHLAAGERVIALAI